MKSEAELDLLVAEACKERQACQVYDEMRRLVSLLNRLYIKSVLEIGTEEGGSLKLWTKLFPQAHFTCVDANTYPHVKGKQQQLEAEWKSWLNKDQSLIVVWDSSHTTEAQRKVANILNPATEDQLRMGKPREYDMLFVDGDHSEEGVEADYNDYMKFVRPGGIAVFADIHPIDRPDMTCWKWWQKFIKRPISQETREYHPGARPNYIEIYHDYGKQRAFGFGIIFK